MTLLSDKEPIRTEEEGMKKLIFPFIIVLLSLSFVFGGEKRPPAPGPNDKCPVCGMFVKKYPDWVAGIIFKDGSGVFFDGAKDMFRYTLDLKKYNPKKSRSDIEAVYVTEYYRLTLMDGTKAFFVIGSDVLGPMGKELIPLAGDAEAKEFFKDHKGKRILTFKEVTPEVIKTLD